MWYPGASYHLMERGIRRMEIFQEAYDYQVFLELLREESEEKKCTIHAYCLMTNHFHLLTETGEIEIGKFMKSLAEKYAMYYNHKYSYRGHVFEGRYKSCLVETDAYFLQTSRYIHLNPVKAKMTEHPEDYPWSSYKTIIQMQDDKIAERQKTLSYFGKKGVYGYREFIENAGTKFLMEEDEIRTRMGENELWLPW
jgi:putative transposase